MSPLALLNPAQAFLAVSTVLTGYCLFRFYAYTAGNLLVVPYLLAAGALLTMAGSCWRLLFTAAAINRVELDGPASGTMSTTAGYFLASFLTVSGLMCAMTGGYNSFRAAGALVLLTLLRSALFRRTEVISPLLGGLSYAMLCVVGMTAHPSFTEILFIQETRMPVVFFGVYMIIALVLGQVRDSSHPPELPEASPANETASRLLDMRGDTVDRTVVWFAGVALILTPLIAAWIMPWRWLSWTILIFLALSLATKLAPVLVYRTRKDLENFLEGVFRGGCLLNAGVVASMGDYRLREIYQGWSIPLPGRDELAAVVIIALLTVPAWLLKRVSPASGTRITN